jgi:hypothetical protein
MAGQIERLFFMHRLDLSVIRVVPQAAQAAAAEACEVHIIRTALRVRELDQGVRDILKLRHALTVVNQTAPGVCELVCPFALAFALSLAQVQGSLALSFAVALHLAVSAYLMSVVYVIQNDLPRVHVHVADAIECGPAHHIAHKDACLIGNAEVTYSLLLG